jgi:hypothetical protein
MRTYNDQLRNSHNGWINATERVAIRLLNQITDQEIPRVQQLRQAKIDEQARQEAELRAAEQAQAETEARAKTIAAAEELKQAAAAETAEKARIEIEPVFGDRLQAIIDKVLATSPAVKAVAKSIIQ